jgi:hypothetical protein
LGLLPPKNPAVDNFFVEVQSKPKIQSVGCCAPLWNCWKKKQAETVDRGHCPPKLILRGINILIKKGSVQKKERGGI